MISPPQLAILTAITILSAVICHKLAKHKGREPVFWGVMGVLFGPFAVLFVLLLKKAVKS